MNELYKKNKTQKGKQNVFLLFGIGLVCLLALIVQKEMEIPRWILLPAAFFGMVFLLGKSMQSPLAAVYVLVCYVPFSKVLVGDFGVSLIAFNLTNGLSILVLIGIFIQSFKSGGPPFKGNSLNWPVFLFCLLSVLSLVRGAYLYGWGYDIPSLIIELKRWLTPVFIFYLVYNALNDKESVKNCIKIMMTVVVLAGAMAAWDYMAQGHLSSLEKARVGGIAQKSNQLAAFMVYYMFLIWGFFLHHIRNPRYWTLLVPILICFRGLQVTFSRGGYVAFAFGLYAITFIRSRLMFVFLIIATGFALLNPWMLPSGVRYRMSMTMDTSYSDIYANEGLEESLEASSRNRIIIWKAGLQMIKDQPMVGFGYGSFPFMIGQYDSRVEGFDAHNSYIIMACEMGLPTLLTFLWIIAVIFFQALWVYRHTKDEFFKSAALGTMGGLAALLMANMFGSRLNSLEISGYLWVLSALILKIKDFELENEKGTKDVSKPKMGLQQRVQKMRVQREDS